MRWGLHEFVCHQEGKAVQARVEHTHGLQHGGYRRTGTRHSGPRHAAQQRQRPPTCRAAETAQVKLGGDLDGQHPW